jgi:4-aminobutyrate aminotransferase
MAKGLASGFPLSAIASRKELMDNHPPGSMGGTYAGNAVACAASRATLKVQYSCILFNSNTNAM